MRVESSGEGNVTTVEITTEIPGGEVEGSGGDEVIIDLRMTIEED